MLGGGGGGGVAAWAPGLISFLGCEEHRGGYWASLTSGQPSSMYVSPGVWNPQNVAPKRSDVTFLKFFSEAYSHNLKDL